MPGKINFPQPECSICHGVIVAIELLFNNIIQWKTHGMYRAVLLIYPHKCYVTFHGLHLTWVLGFCLIFTVIFIHIISGRSVMCFMFQVT